jgi:hypothetical protein
MTNNPPIPPRSPAVAKYLEHHFRPAITKGSGGTGRLIFALDTTAGRQLTWDTACALQNTMFDAVAGLGGLFAQLVYYRGYDECEASKWFSRAAELHRVMRTMSCVGGETQIERVLRHAIRETGKNRGGAVVFVGDAMEEKVDRLGRLAGELGPLSVRIFVFHEGSDPTAAAAFKQIAALSGLLTCRSIAPAQLGSRNCSGHLRSLRSAAIGRSRRSPRKRVARSCASATS